MDKREKLVSILLPVYNVERFLSDCLDTIVSQTYKNLEIILADDGSTDSSGAICDRYARQDSRIRVIHKANQGLLLTRRRLFSEASGEYVLCVDSDDWIERTAIEKAMELVCKTDADIVIFGYDARRDLTAPVRRSFVYTEEDRVFCGKELEQIYRDMTFTGRLNYIWHKLIARSLIHEEDDENPIYQTLQLGEDIVQLFPIVARAEIIASLGEILYHYRLSDSGMSRNFKMNYLQDKLTIFREKEKFLADQGISSPEDWRKLHTRTYLEVLQSVYSLVHCGRYSTEEIKKAMESLNEDERFLQLRKFSDIRRWRKMDRLVEGLFRRRRYRELTLFLRTEHFLIRRMRRQ